MPSSKKRVLLDLLSKVLEHELVPRHEVLSVEEGARVLKEYGIKPEQLPWLRASDPVARAIGAKPGDIVRIVRKSPTGGEVVVYRYVVPG
ncbi:MAG: DNA-directed RNA polymerase subunit H [Ignisphaera sp.]|jgi:DNA-directed RNA polymerase subunit H|nr:DNA-directed RNA polymerase subunit H [Ignisphaera sp.]MCC6055431.1 DNA-directed RNA polymerase subunit H [Desulfurococcaceae archaeon]